MLFQKSVLAYIIFTSYFWDKYYVRNDVKSLVI